MKGVARRSYRRRRNYNFIETIIIYIMIVVSIVMSVQQAREIGNNIAARHARCNKKECAETIVITAKPKFVAVVDAQPAPPQPVKQEKRPEISAEAPCDQYLYIVDEMERSNMEKVVYMEARGESLEGQVAVAAVILNRFTSHDAFFDTSSITAVITQKYQFASIAGVTQEMLDEYPECAEAVDMALRGWDPTRKAFPEGAKFFYQPDITYGYEAEIRQGIEYCKIGCHRFHNDLKD